MLTAQISMTVTHAPTLSRLSKAREGNPPQGRAYGCADGEPRSETFLL